MKIAILASLVIAAAGDACKDAAGDATKLGQKKTAGGTGGKCECGSDNIEVADDEYCAILSDGKGKKHTDILAKECVGNTKCEEADGSICKKEADIVSVCAKDTICAKDDGKCYAACDKVTAQEANAADCVCGKNFALVKTDAFCAVYKDETGASVAEKVTAVAEANAKCDKDGKDCVCKKGEDIKGVCKNGQICNGDDGTCKDADADAEVGACPNVDGTVAVEAECKCGDGDDKCAKTKFCLKTADAGSRCKDAAAETTKATTETTAAPTKFDEAATKAAYDVLEKAFKALTADAVKKALEAAGLAGIEGDITVTGGEGKAVVMSAKFKEDPNKMKDATAKDALVKAICTACGITDVTACDIKFVKARRLEASSPGSERRLAAEKYDVTVKMVSKDAYVAAKKKAAGGAAALTSSASAFGFAVAIGFAALY